eukprot:2999604-Rhodomonas_salina.1
MRLERVCFIGRRRRVGIPAKGRNSYPGYPGYPVPRVPGYRYLAWSCCSKTQSTRVPGTRVPP